MKNLTPKGEIIISKGIEKAFDNIRHPFLVFGQDPMLREHRVPFGTRATTGVKCKSS